MRRVVVGRDSSGFLGNLRQRSGSCVCSSLLQALYSEGMYDKGGPAGTREGGQHKKGQNAKSESD
jgi:hypothetical protein